MKKIVCSLFFVCAVVVAHAQISVGLKVGLNVAQVRYEIDSESETTKAAVGFQGGAFVNFGVSDVFSIQPELFFSRLGGKESEYIDDLGSDVDQTYKIDYLSLPVLFKFQVAPNVNLHVGPQLGILAGAKVKVEALGQSVEADAKDSFNTLDFGLNGGIGFNVQKFGFDLRYYYGLANIADDPEIQSEGANRAFQFIFSYRLTND